MFLRTPRGRKLITLLIASVLFAASAGWVVVRFQWRDVLTALLKVDFIRLFILISICHFAYIVIRAFRWRSAVRNVIPDVAFWDCYWITAVVVSLAVLTPGHAGEALKIEMMKRRGLLGRLPGFGAFAVERILDSVMLSAAGAIGLCFGAYAATDLGLQAGAIGFAVVGTVALCGLVWIGSGRRAPRKLTEMLRSVSPRALASMALCTAIGWLLVALIWQISLNAVEIHLEPPQVLLLLWLVTVGAVLSFIPGGLGVSELVTAVVLTNMGVSAVSAQAGALILHAYGLVAILFGLVHLGLWPICGPLRAAADGNLRDAAGKV
jgi:uncharacterized membrane protein YbhN (UPF0104 family)